MHNVLHRRTAAHDWSKWTDEELRCELAHESGVDIGEDIARDILTARLESLQVLPEDYE